MASEFNIKLAQLVKNYPAIYDIMNPAYRKEEVKSKAWKCIADELHIPQAKCMIKWKSLKHQYVKCKKEGSTAWDMLGFMQFLDESSTKTKGRKRKNAPVAEANAPAVQDVSGVETMDVETSYGIEVDSVAPSLRTQKETGEVQETEETKSPKRTLRGGRRASGRHFEVLEVVEQSTKANGSADVPEPTTKPKSRSPKTTDKTAVIILNSDEVSQFQRDSRAQEQGTKLPVTPSRTPTRGRKSIRLTVVPEEMPLKQDEVDLPEVPPKRETKKRKRQSAIPEPPLVQQGEQSPAKAETRKTKDPLEGQLAEKLEEADQGDEAFVTLVLKGLAKLPHTIKPSIKASILGLLDGAAK